MTALTQAQTDALAKRAAPIAFFAEFNFAGGIVRVTNFNQTITWGGYDWTGLGALGAIDAVQMDNSLTPRGLNFTLNIANSSILALAMNQMENYRGRYAKLYRVPLDDQFRLVGTPQLCWNGFMDQMTIGVAASGEGQIVLKCETANYNLRRRPTVRLNATQWAKRSPNDTFFKDLTGIIARPTLWLSVRFQRQ